MWHRPSAGDGKRRTVAASAGVGIHGCCGLVERPRKPRAGRLCALRVAAWPALQRARRARGLGPCTHREWCEGLELQEVWGPSSSGSCQPHRSSPCAARPQPRVRESLWGPFGADVGAWRAAPLPLRSAAHGAGPCSPWRAEDHGQAGALRHRAGDLLGSDCSFFSRLRFPLFFPAFFSLTDSI